MTPTALLNHSQDEIQTKPGPIPKLRETFRDMETLELHSSGGAIDPDSVGWLEPTSKDTPTEKMREQYNRDGYLWVKGVLPKEDVWEMRKTYFDYMPGLTKEGTDTRDGIYCGGDWRLVSLLGYLSCSNSTADGSHLTVDATWKASPQVWT